MNRIEVIAINGLPVVKEHDDLAKLIYSSAIQQGTPIKEKDIIVITHVIVSRAEGNVVKLDLVIPSETANFLAQELSKDPALIEVILRESKNIVRRDRGKLITETKHGFICANSGVDQSNVPGKKKVALLPKNPDRSAQRIRKKIKKFTGKDVAVIISDTHGRPLRKGEINVAIGVSGINPIKDQRGRKDLFGYTLKVKRTAIADELCSAAELVIGQASEAIPVAIIRGYVFPKSENAKATDMIRPKEEELFL